VVCVILVMTTQSLRGFSGFVKTKASQVRAVSIYLQLLMNISDIEITQRYLICNPLPKTTDAIEDITDKIYQRMVAREDEAIQKLRQVIDFATGEDCE
jgi:hypothetical protein